MNALPASATRTKPARLAAWRRALLALLIVAMPLHAVGATITQWLGARHFHAPTTAEAVMAPSDADAVMVDWQFLRRIEIGVGAEPSASMRAEAHSHAGIERHRHSPLDGSVIALDDDGHDRGDAAGGGTSGAAATLAQPFALPCLALVPVDPASATVAGWPALAGPPPARLSAERLERPPRV